MKILVNNRRLFTWFCVLPLPADAGIGRHILRIFITVCAMLMMIWSLVSSMMFIMRVVTTDLNAALYAMFHFSGILHSFYTAIVCYILRLEITALFDDFQAIYDKYEKTDTHRYLTKMDEQTQSFTRTFTICTLFGFPLNIVVVCLTSAVFSYILNGYVVVESLVVPYTLVQPWNQETFIGWFYNVIYSGFMCASYFVSNSPIQTFFITFCYYHGAFEKYFESVIDKMNEITKSNRYIECKPLLVHSIQFHFTAKTMFNKTSNIYSILLFILLICSVLMLACSILQVDAAFNSADAQFFVVMLASVASSANLFLYCFYGKLATDNFLNYGDSLYESNWYELPVYLQKFLIVSIGNMQLPLTYHGFGVINLNLMSFTNMMRTVFSYYMMFKTLSAE